MMARGGLGGNELRNNRIPLGGWLDGNELRHNCLETNYDITTDFLMGFALSKVADKIKDNQRT
jgi:hypothetical protein